MSSLAANATSVFGDGVNTQGSWPELLQEHYVQVDWGVAFHFYNLPRNCARENPCIANQYRAYCAGVFSCIRTVRLLPQALGAALYGARASARVKRCPFISAPFCVFHVANSKDELIRKSITAI